MVTLYNVTECDKGTVQDCVESGSGHGIEAPERNVSQSDVQR